MLELRSFGLPSYFFVEGRQSCFFFNTGNPGGNFKRGSYFYKEN